MRLEDEVYMRLLNRLIYQRPGVAPILRLRIASSYQGRKMGLKATRNTRNLSTLAEGWEERRYGKSLAKKKLWRQHKLSLSGRYDWK